MTEHSILSPSSFPRLVACPGSRKLETMFPREESEAADDGILAHENASKWLQKYFSNDEEFIHSTGDYSMDDHINVYIDHVVSKVNKNEKPHIEERIDIPYLHPECFGTPDCWYYDEQKNEVHVWDFKYGFKPIEVVENWQLIGYACGIIDKVFQYYINEKAIENMFKVEISTAIIHLHIVQPRANHREGPIRKWSLTRDAIWEYVNIIKEQIEKSFLEEPPFSVGAHCQYCKARNICEKFKSKSRNIMKSVIDLSKFTSEDDLSEFMKEENIEILTKEDIKKGNGFIEPKGQKITKKEFPGLFEAINSQCHKDIVSCGFKLKSIENEEVEKLTTLNISINDLKSINSSKFKPTEEDSESEYDKIFITNASFRRRVLLEELITETTEPEETHEQFVERFNEKFIPLSDCKTTEKEKPLIFKMTKESISHFEKFFHDKSRKSENLISCNGQSIKKSDYPELSAEITQTRQSISLLQMRLQDLEKEAMSKIESGEKVEGYKIKPVFSRTSWSIPVEDVCKIGEQYNLNFSKPQRIETITPNQAIKLAKKNEDIISHIRSLSGCKFKENKLVHENEQDYEEINFDEL